MVYLKKLIIRCVLITAISAVISASAAATDLGISLRIGQPGFYGEIHLGDFYPVPELIYPEPVIIHRPSVYLQQQPIYLHVPPGHVRLWHRYCYQYNACNRPVYFVHETWYNNVYVPHYHQHVPQQQRYYENPQQRHYDSDRHYQDRRHDTYRRYDDDHDHREKRRIKDGPGYGYDKYDRHDKHDRYDKHDKHDRGRGRKHDD